MSIHISILGLDRIGASIGLALGSHSDQFERSGYDRQQPTAMHARKINAVDRVELNLPKSVKQADVILLALPLAQVKETLKTIGCDVRSGVVILDTSPAKQVVAGWISEFIPVKHHYVCITPIFNSDHLMEQDESIRFATSDLFERGLMAIGAPAGTEAAAIKLAADLCILLGTTPFFCDMAEMDGFTASTRLLPKLISTALLNATLNQPGWVDASKFCGADYTAVSSGVSASEESASLCNAVLLNKTHLLRSLDGVLAAIYALRDDIESERSGALETKLENAREGRVRWWLERQKVVPQSKDLEAGEMPKAGDFWKQQLGFLNRLSGPRPAKPEKKD